jgi:hypothetical protein
MLSGNRGAQDGEPFCEKHPDTDPVCYCPLCRAAEGGKKTAAGMTKKARVERAEGCPCALFQRGTNEALRVVSES